MHRDGLLSQRNDHRNPSDKTAAAPYGEKHLVSVMNQGGIKNNNGGVPTIMAQNDSMMKGSFKVSH